MSIGFIAIFLGGLALAGAMAGLLYPEKFRAFMLSLPRNVLAGRILAGACCVLAAREAYIMNMGGLNQYKALIFYIAPIVFACCCFYLKELLAARALGGMLCLMAVPVVKIAALSGAPYFQVISAIGYIWATAGIILLMAPWQFRRSFERAEKNNIYYKGGLIFKAASGLALVGLGIFIY